MDDEDLDDIVRDIAHRAGRSMEDIEENPMFAKVKTVGDLVQFLNYQPPANAA